MLSCRGNTGSPLTWIFGVCGFRRRYCILPTGSVANFRRFGILPFFDGCACGVVGNFDYKVREVGNGYPAFSFIFFLFHLYSQRGRSREPVFSSAGGSGLSSLQLYIGSIAAAQIASDNILVLIRAVLYVVCVSILILSRRCIAASPIYVQIAEI